MKTNRTTLPVLLIFFLTVFSAIGEEESGSLVGELPCFLRMSYLHSSGILYIVMGLFLLSLAVILFLDRKTRLYAKVVSNIPFRFFVFDGGGRLLLYSLGSGKNQFFFKKTKYRTLDELPDSEPREIVRANLTAVIREGKTMHFDYAFGEELHSALLYRLPEGMFRTAAAVWIVQDTTELQKSRSDARQKEERLRLTLQSIGDGVIATDDKERITMINPAGEAMTGYSAAEAAGKRLEEIFRPLVFSTGEAVSSPLSAVLRDGVSGRFGDHIDLVSRDGSRYHISDSVSPVHDAIGNVTGAILVFRDITEHYRQRDRLRNALGKAQSLNAELQDLLTKYDFVMNNTPLYFYAEDIDDGFRHVFCSRYCSELWGLPVEKILGKSDFELFRNLDEVREFRRTDIETASGSGVTDMVLPFTGMDGKRRIGRFFRQKLNLSGNRHWLFGIVADITRESELLENERVMNECLAILFREENIVRAINGVLGRLARHMKASRCTLLKIDLERREVSVAARCAEGVNEEASFPAGSLKIPAEDIPLRRVLNRETVCYSDLRDELQRREFSFWGSVCGRREPRSVRIRGIFLGKEFWGALSLVYDEGLCPELSDRERKFLESAANLMELLLKKERARRRLAEEESEESAEGPRN